MTDQELLAAFTDRIAARGLIHPHEASILLARAGYDLPRDTEPLAVSDDNLRLAAVILAALLRMKDGRPTLEKVRERIAALQLRHLLDANDRAHEEFERRNRLLAGMLAAGMAVWLWHRHQRANVAGHVIAQAVLGGRGALRRPDAVAATLREQGGFLLGFADELALKRSRGETVTADAVTARADLYGGAGRKTFYQELEAYQAALGPLPGWVHEYIPKDDAATCLPCHAAKGFYLIGQGPWPGDVCDGRGRCRCRRVPRYLPAVYAELLRDASAS